MNNQELVSDLQNLLRQISNQSSVKYMLFTESMHSVSSSSSSSSSSTSSPTTCFHNSVSSECEIHHSSHFNQKQVEGIKEVLSSATLATIKPTLCQMRTIKIYKHQHPTALIKQYRDLFNSLSQVICKEVAKAWIKIIEPYKQALFPYRDYNLSRPSWWPPHVNHIEPDHLDKFGRVEVLINILRHPKFDLREVDLRMFAKKPIIQSILKEILYLAIYDRLYFNITSGKKQDDEYDNDDTGLLNMVGKEEERKLLDKAYITILTSDLRSNGTDELIMCSKVKEEHLNHDCFTLNYSQQQQQQEEEEDDGGGLNTEFNQKWKENKKQQAVWKPTKVVKKCSKKRKTLSRSTSTLTSNNEVLAKDIVDVKKKNTNKCNNIKLEKKQSFNNNRNNNNQEVDNQTTTLNYDGSSESSEYGSRCNSLLGVGCTRQNSNRHSEFLECYGQEIKDNNRNRNENENENENENKNKSAIANSKLVTIKLEKDHPVGNTDVEFAASFQINANSDAYETNTEGAISAIDQHLQETCPPFKDHKICHADNSVIISPTLSSTSTRLDLVSDANLSLSFSRSIYKEEIGDNVFEDNNKPNGLYFDLSSSSDEMLYEYANENFDPQFALSEVLSEVSSEVSSEVPDNEGYTPYEFNFA